MIRILLPQLLSILFCQSIPYFDGSRAFEYLEKQCEFGPRYPGSKGHTKTSLYFEEFLKDLSHDLLVMKEPITHPYRDETIVLTNLLARYYPDRQERILLMAHWDTREIADKDPILKNQSKPILGANDGASGISVLMVMAEILKENKLNTIGVDLLFVDGEDMGKAGEPQNFGLGTIQFSKKIPKPYPKYAVCLDMVGDAEPSFYMEPYSLQQAPRLIKEVWAIAENLGYKEFEPRIGKPVFDDHRVLFIHTGIPSIDIIDFEYPNADTNYWHTLSDIPENCSPRTLERVGTVVTTLIFQEDFE